MLMHVDRFRKLADFLDTVPADKFNLDYWVGTVYDDGRIVNYSTQPAGSCGTVACAMGWATTIPEFAELGLYHEGFHIHYDTETDIAASASFFGISIPHARWLFYPENYNPRERTDPRVVAARIRRFVFEFAEFYGVA